MPLKHLLEDPLPIGLNRIPMTGYDPVEIPTSNLLRALVETLPISSASCVP